MIEKASLALPIVIGLVVLVLARKLYAQWQINGPLQFEPDQTLLLSVTGMQIMLFE